MKPQDDAKGQYAKSQAKPSKDGVMSAKPTVVTGSQDATIHRDPPGKTKPDADGNVNFDETQGDRS